jgi:iron complex outermembrane receptor protein
VYGVEAWGDYDVTRWWRLSASVNALRDELEFAPGSSRLLGVGQDGDDPPFQASLHSAISPRSDVTWDAYLRHVDATPNTDVAAYTELNTSIAWRVADHLRLSISGFNLLHDHHREYAGGMEIPRSVFAEARTWF